MVIGGCCIIAFGFYESYANLKYPLMPMSFFRNRGYISLVTIITISSMYYYSAVLLWSVTRHLSPVSHLLCSHTDTSLLSTLR